jgi:hypothetical protein
VGGKEGGESGPTVVATRTMSVYGRHSSKRRRAHCYLLQAPLG